MRKTSIPIRQMIKIIYWWQRRNKSIKIKNPFEGTQASRKKWKQKNEKWMHYTATNGWLAAVLTHSNDIKILTKITKTDNPQPKWKKAHPLSPPQKKKLKTLEEGRENPIYETHKKEKPKMPSNLKPQNTLSLSVSQGFHFHLDHQNRSKT